ncbi:putative FAD-linked oxidase [Gordonia effusa NBRC 100432]|uniref:Putative FAD-linked oxidase n=1 Tax=Gordonia effusa NBRC 100432 TaxID=1077974 RepID=H0QUV9_9ACTN|nr:FAD-binding oxidoreductase [Gordonia effusa]GAB16610.1 putative FAD-linked oxidase [Gordonia effusa NBRC 100432]
MTVGALKAFADVVGAPHVITDPDAARGYLTDWTGRYTGAALAVIRPASTAEVAGIVKVCAAHGIKICTQGGNTGLVGGSVPAEAGFHAVVLSTARMADVGPLDEVDKCIEVQAGVTVAQIAMRAREVGLSFGVDLASRDSATAGGIVATNAGGIHTIAHGDTRAQVRGIEAVLADGTVVRRWKRLVKDNVGYDVPGLLAGSEGTLAIITRVLFTLVRPAASRLVVVAAIDDTRVALDLVDVLSDSGLRVEAAELMTSAGVELVHEYGYRRPTSVAAPYYALIEVSGSGDLDAVAAEAISGVAGVRDVVAQQGAARDLWAIREGHTEAIARSSSTVPVKLDISVPLTSIAESVKSFAALGDAQNYRCRTILFGHVGDGNIHVNYLDVPAEEQDALADAALRLAVEADGSVSAEHGIGRAKVGWISTRDPADVAAMKAIRAALDPHELLNPGVLW